ncbi:UDP-N-acetylmuramoylalanyl-D-glutamate--2,6-diaminopimelate ligase [hydrothermal vent metagenome]|uniref:UDP-N-acetylmuramoylalanyl-D-glutamate--2,6-diaminopimelate ligase n=1 Tax=hydrothermal vent metagenome TaxID=652676 RepID=A0A1W1DAJ9_9ZZZZ
MKITQLLTDIIDTKFDLDVSGLCLNSQQVQYGDVFVALQGAKSHGADYADQAIDKGCVAILVDSKDLECSVPTIRIDNLASHLSTLANAVYADALKVDVIGVTGTNGKTSVSHFIAQLLTKLGVSTGLIGTLGITQSELSSSHTTPDILTLYRTLSNYHQQNIKVAVLEVSSHALAQDRISGLNITQAVFTNFSQDHLDYHQTLDAYKLEKLKLFQLASVKNVVLNADDSSHADFDAAAKNTQNYHYSINDFDDIKINEHGFITHLKGFVFEIPFLGEFNLMNVLAAYHTLKARNFTNEQIIPLLHQLNPPPGRMQKNAQQLIWVDYAHTPDAIEKAIITLQNHYPEHKIRVIFGCGGNRDKDKRAKMGKITSKLADTIILTNDNPRDENPQTIINDILSGIDDSYSVIITENRQIAIENAVITLGEEECLLIAGKGHETTQIFNHETLESNDNDMVLAAIIEAARLKKIKNKQR